MSDGEKLGLFFVIVGLGLLVGKASAKLARGDGRAHTCDQCPRRHRGTRTGRGVVGRPEFADA